MPKYEKIRWNGEVVETLEIRRTNPRRGKAKKMADDVKWHGIDYAASEQRVLEAYRIPAEVLESEGAKKSPVDLLESALNVASAKFVEKESKERGIRKVDPLKWELAPLRWELTPESPKKFVPEAYQSGPVRSYERICPECGRPERVWTPDCHRIWTMRSLALGGRGR